MDDGDQTAKTPFGLGSHLGDGWNVLPTTQNTGKPAPSFHPYVAGGDKPANLTSSLNSGGVKADGRAYYWPEALVNGELCRDVRAVTDLGRLAVISFTDSVGMAMQLPGSLIEAFAIQTSVLDSPPIPRITFALKLEHSASVNPIVQTPEAAASSAQMEALMGKIAATNPLGLFAAPPEPKPATWASAPQPAKKTMTRGTIWQEEPDDA